MGSMRGPDAQLWVYSCSLSWTAVRRVSCQLNIGNEGATAGQGQLLTNTFAYIRHATLTN